MNEHWEQGLNPEELELAKLILAQLRQYPASEIQDVAKLLYQRTFGPGHLVSDEARSLERLEREAKAAPTTAHLSEDLGNGLVRIQLGSWASTGLSLNLLNRMFLQTAQAYSSGTNSDHLDPGAKPGAGSGAKPGAGSGARSGSTTDKRQLSYENQLATLQKLTDLGVLPFPSEETAKWLADYRRKGYPVQSHSDAYKRAYQPAYRVIEANYVPLFPLLADLEKKLTRVPTEQQTESQTQVLSKTQNQPKTQDQPQTQNQPKTQDQPKTPSLVVAIDGRTGSGKSTVANLLAGLWPKESALIEMDDFFLPTEKRTPERYAEAGGNVDYERFQAEVINSLRSSIRPFKYRVFDCSIMEFHGAKTVPETKLTIIEGSYSQLPRFGRYYDLAVFVNIDPETQIARISKRNPEKAPMFASTWIPLEEKYFAAYDIASQADFIVRLP